MDKIDEILEAFEKSPNEEPSKFEPLILRSIDYLESEAAFASIGADPYWPKWDAPWWHLSVLFEMGAASRIPKPIAKCLLDEIAETHLPYFFKSEAPPNKTEKQDAPCPGLALGF